MVLIKETFKLKYKTHAYWIDSLTLMWDSYILADRLDTYGRM